MSLCFDLSDDDRQALYLLCRRNNLSQDEVVSRLIEAEAIHPLQLLPQVVHPTRCTVYYKHINGSWSNKEETYPPGSEFAEELNQILDQYANSGSK
jgi:hypothetical protein